MTVTQWNLSYGPLYKKFPKERNSWDLLIHSMHFYTGYCLPCIKSKTLIHRILLDGHFTVYVYLQKVYHNILHRPGLTGISYTGEVLWSQSSHCTQPDRKQDKTQWQWYKFDTPHPKWPLLQGIPFLKRPITAALYAAYVETVLNNTSVSQVNFLYPCFSNCGLQIVPGLKTTGRYILLFSSHI
jgi:hypothetical protein